ncbi:Protein EURL [Manis javanica]|nr:Protein EURL [Manis javanica]
MPETIVEEPEPRGTAAAARGAGRGSMNQEEQFVNIDLNDDNVCSVCKLGTDKETLSFCHVCFELNIEGVPKSNLLHSSSLRGHRDCFEKYHLIANQDCTRSKLSKSTYEEVKTILSKKINWIVQYAQNKDLDSDSECSKNPQHHLLNFRHKPDKKLLPQFDSQVPKYSAKWIDGSTGGLSNCTQRILEQKEKTDFELAMLQDSGASLHHSSVLWPHSQNQAQKKEETLSSPEADAETQHPHYSRGELNLMTLREVKQLNAKLQQQIQEVFEELTHQVQEKDSLASELHVRHIAIEQLLKNYSKLPCVQITLQRVILYQRKIPLNLNRGQPKAHIFETNFGGPGDRRALELPTANWVKGGGQKRVQSRLETAALPGPLL